MSDKQKIPSNELSGEKSLNGTYKISFTVNINDNDNTVITDIIQAIASGFDGSPILSKIAHVDIEKISKSGAIFKPGDNVIFENDTQINVHVVEDVEGFYVVGLNAEPAGDVGDMTITIPASMTAVVNKITETGVELIDFSSPVSVVESVWGSDEELDTDVYIETLIVDPSVLQKVGK